MATIIDELVALITLDPTRFTKGKKEVERGLKDMREGAEKQTKEIDKFDKRVAEGLSKVRNEMVGLFLAFQGASTVTSFLKNLITGDATTGRLAKNIGMATSELSAWQMTMRATGGDAANASGDLEKITGAYQKWLLLGEADPNFKFFGINAEDLKDGTSAFLKMADAAQRMDPATFAARMKMIGMSDDTINMVRRGRGELEKLMEAKRRDAAAAKENADAAQGLLGKLGELQTKVEVGLRPTLYSLVETATDLTDVLLGNAQMSEKAKVSALAFGTAIAFALGPVGLLAEGIALIALNLDTLKQKWHEFEGFWEGLSTSTDKIFDPLRKKLGLKTGEEARRDNTDVFGNPVGGTNNTVTTGATGGNNWIKNQQTSVGRYIAGMNGSQAKNGAYIEQWFRAHGIDAETARGIAGGILAESGGDPNARNPTSGAYGLGQHLGDRQKRLFARYGRNPSMNQQLEFLLWELMGGDAGGAAVLGAGSAAGAGSAYIRAFMRPAKGYETARDLRAVNSYLGRAGAPANDGAAAGGDTQTTHIGTINVYTAATDAKGIAADLPPAIQQRGLVNQANRGLR